MAAWLIPVVVGAASILQSMSASEAQAQNAEISEEWAYYNAAQAQKAAEFNASAIESLAEVNASLIYSSTENSAMIVESLARYNAAIRVQVAEYNAQLLEKEAALVWEAQELDQVLYAREAERTIKDLRAQFAANGIEITNGSPLDYIVDQATQAKLESFIIRHNADIEMTKLLDAAALSRWEGQMEAATIVMEGQMSALSTRTQGQLDASAVTIQGAYDAAMARFTGEIQESSILQDGLWTASQYSQAATQTLISGLFSGISSGLQSYSALNSTTTTTTDTNIYLAD